MKSWVATLLVIVVVLILIAISFGSIYVVVGWVNSAFHLGWESHQLLIATVVAWLILGVLGQRGVSHKS